jgi:hypothetical protein
MFSGSWKVLFSIPGREIGGFMPSFNQVDITVLRKVVDLLTEGKSVAEVFLDNTVNGISLLEIKEIESILKSEAKNPLARLEDAGRASVLNYNVPTSTSYRGLLYIFIRHPQLDMGSQYDWFKDEVKK